jgi:hypothetical protein
MKKYLLTVLFLWVTIGSAFAKTSIICIHNPSALAGTILVGTVLSFFVANLLSRIFKTKNKAASFIFNLFLVAVWAGCCLLVCYLIRLIFF